MKNELYAEVRQLVLAHQGPWLDEHGKPAACSHCETRWAKIRDVLDRIVDNADEILLDTLVEQAKAEELRRRGPARRLPPRGPR
ncbi:hypothetical protein ACFY7C_19350 [Streptomyces sp. NPDC012769]|uniref:hypothetical protein n=1 Tax=Streptomyces sp. NPDC012769 TaxID=3364848 RepID=UPI0036BC499D